MRAQVVGGELGCQSKHTDNSGTVAETDHNIIAVDASDGRGTAEWEPLK